jgi:antitoxin PrlF
MATVTLTSKGQLTIPRQLRDALGLAPGARLQASIDRHGRLVLVPSKYEPEDLFRHRPRVERVMSVEDMDRAISAAAGKAPTWGNGCARSGKAPQS